MKGRQRIINVSNRLPIKMEADGGQFSYVSSEGGLATGLSSLFKTYDHLWIGWPGAVVPDGEQPAVVRHMQAQKLHPVFLSKQEINDYYEGFCNETIWPLFHYFPSYSGFDLKDYETYKTINQRFADEIVRFARPDDVIWIHDYQLMLVPQMVREKIPGLTIGFFLHIPFPAYPVFMALPWREEILRGLMGADVLGFQTQDDAAHFIDGVQRTLDISFTGNEAAVDTRTVVARAFPISIDYNKYNSMAQDDCIAASEASVKELLNGTKLAISVDRLDYSKGILQRLRAFEAFLQQHPEWIEQVTLLHLVVPSRDTVRNYKELKEEMDRLVNSINGKYATLGWQPIRHFYRSVPPELLAAIYKRADVALVTPLRDGMNLVCKEYIASQVNGNGVLVLSEMAGAAKELPDAIIINPNDIHEYAAGIQEALTMDSAEKKARMLRMQRVVATANIFSWADKFMDAMTDVKSRQSANTARYISSAMLQKLEMKYCYATQKLVLLDYDGTLVPFHSRPEAAVPDKQLLELIGGLAGEASNKVVIISGRDHNTLEQWLGALPVDLIAEHGAWYREQGNAWTSRRDMETAWKPEFFNILNAFTKSTPGSLIEEKTYSIAWHYRQCDAALGRIRAKEIEEALSQRAGELGLQLLPGDKVLEIKNAGINKGLAARKWMSKQRYDLIVAIGDDTTDEDMFRALPDNAVTIKVGTNITDAAYFVNNYKDVRKLLEHMIDASAHFNKAIALQLAG